LFSERLADSGGAPSRERRTPGTLTITLRHCVKLHEASDRIGDLSSTPAPRSISKFPGGELVHVELSRHLTNRLPLFNHRTVNLCKVAHLAVERRHHHRPGLTDRATEMSGGEWATARHDRIRKGEE
jgi:hypothetical protein